MVDSQNERATNGGASQAALWRRAAELDVYESASEFLVLLNVPGATPDSVDVQVVGNELHVRAEQAASAAHAAAARAAFERHFELPADVEAGSAVAELRAGVLEVRIQKSASARRVKIPVSAN